MYDFVIIGAGIVGLSVAMQLGENDSDAKIAVIEKEKEISLHQTGRNSGVIHSGIYYKPGSFKAKFAREGNAHMVQFCKENGIPYERCGKLIVAVTEKEVPLMENLYQRGLKNGLSVKKVMKDDIKEIEPNVRAIAGIFVPSTGIVDYRKVAAVYADKIKQKQGDLLTDTEIKGVQMNDDRIVLTTSQGDIQARFLINCAGLYSDKVAEMAGVKTDMKIVPFRGEYYQISANKKTLVKNLVYPVPNPDFPFLGVHFTRMMNGSVHIGPNAVLSLRREGYSKTDIHWREAAEILRYGAFWKIAGSNMREGMKEMIKSFSKRAFVKDVQRYFPQLEEKDLVPAKAGVRAQALSRDGKLLDDFFIVKHDRAVHVCNAPSPAATASLEIGARIVHLVKKQVRNG
ncbi:MAG TPA: L-2-hydroxyglutarate oxidase [Bacillales bacterium]|nr:L-2-hydroxyglutarate oxidase [Bacillales bacterium]